MPAMMPVAIQGVSKGYGRSAPVLDDVSLDVAGGELFFLLGASGCGKTTLLRLVAGFLRPDAGSIRFGEREVTALPAEHRGIGMVFQQYALWPHLSVGENVAFGLDLRAVPAPERRKKVEDMLALVELPGFAARRIAELSGGQQQRVALARALVVSPPVLLLDEPLSNLDARLRVGMRATIRRLCKAAGVTALYVTHDQGEALSTADRIALLHRGRVAQVGTPRELYEHPRSRIVAETMGEANVVAVTVAGRDALRGALGGALLPAAVPAGMADGAAALACIRPERLRVVAPGAAAAGSALLTGTVQGSSYLGECVRLQVRCGDETLTVSEPLGPPREAGAAITVAVRAEDVAVLPP
jgi:ABC-type Fe3+/spermidine/putrescine transport system ATPase subunit